MWPNYRAVNREIAAIHLKTCYLFSVVKSIFGVMVMVCQTKLDGWAQSALCVWL